MSKVILDMSMSLDGYVTAAGGTPQEPAGAGGDRLTEWAMGGDAATGELLAASAASLGAVISGWRTYETSLPWWGADGPTGPARLPLFVVTHGPPPGDVPEGGVYTFVTDGIEGALKRAREAAGGKDVAVMGGADTARRFLRAGLVDHIGIHLAPVIFGGGGRLFDDIGDAHVRLEVVKVTDTPKATHLLYRIVG